MHRRSKKNNGYELNHVSLELATCSCMFAEPFSSVGSSGFPPPLFLKKKLSSEIFLYAKIYNREMCSGTLANKTNLENENRKKVLFNIYSFFSQDHVLPSLPHMSETRLLKQKIK